MKKFLVIALCLLFAASFVISCGEKEAAQDKVEKTAAGAAEEMADTTRLDSMAGEAMDAVEGAVEEAGEAAEGAVDKAKEAAGH